MSTKKTNPEAGTNSLSPSLQPTPVANRRLAQGALSRTRLIAAARALFEKDGYANTSTEALLLATGLTRGALYHHFRDKKDLFVAVCEAVHIDLSSAIEKAADTQGSPRQQLIAGAMAWIDAISQPGPRQVLLIDGPSVLRAETWARLDERHGYQQLRTVLSEILSPEGELSGLEIDASTSAINGAINELAQWLARHPADAFPDARDAAMAALRRVCNSVLTSSQGA
ncbi:TetR/AcrR family transcriptional regulator [Undibacterium pigrum]|uniref:TetR family transcriptional regulator n=1 Tax=Undibacterium pigrum TaxID=401470 RepID=A0A318J5G9_9BURK|nr:TetR/AcrR family transcriptional regulator [Undibacterium pigrum]PXX42663.1 TetR family transcriptional regulator [Undibacterium pigrum]